jgi:hypothetical protein
MGMKSLVMKSIYTGLGLLGSGKETVEQLGRKLAKQANVSEKDGERIARDLQARSQKAITAMQKTLHSEVNKVVSAMRAATKEMSAPPAKKRTAKRRRS